MSLNMADVEYAPNWLLHKLNSATIVEIVKICTVLWGVWFWRNRRVWDDRSVTSVFAMDKSFKSFNSWRRARQLVLNTTIAPVDPGSNRHCSHWLPPAVGAYKVNVDASFFTGEESFTVGMVLRDHGGNFIAGRTLKLQAPNSVFEAEAIGVKEALS